MEELKILVNMVATLPQMALWVIAFFFIYKISIIGSIYSLIRYITTKLHNWAITKKGETKELIKEKGDIRNMVITHDGTYDELIKVIKGLRSTSTNYIHASDIEWLKLAIKEKRASEQHK